MKKVYLVIDEGCYCGDGCTDVRVYADYLNAKRDFINSRAQLIADWIDDGSWVIETDDDDYFDIGEEGYHAHSHATLSVVEKEIMY